MIDNSRFTWISAILQTARVESVKKDSDIEDFLKSTGSYSLRVGWKGLSSSGCEADSESYSLTPLLTTTTPRLESIQAIVDEVLHRFGVSRKFVRRVTRPRSTTTAPLDLTDEIGEDEDAYAPDFVFASSSRTVLRLEGAGEGLQEECSQVNDYMHCVSFLKVQARGETSEFDSDTPEPDAQLATYARYVINIYKNESRVDIAY